MRLGEITPPNLQGDACYYAAWLRFERNMESYEDPEAGFKEILDEVDAAVSRLGNRKAFRGRVLSRGLCFALYRPMTTIVLRISIREEARGDAVPGIEVLCNHLAAQVVGETRFQRGENFILQLMSDAGTTISHLDLDDVELLDAWWHATRRRHLFQLMGSLHALCQEIPKPEPKTCSECGSPVRWDWERLDEPREVIEREEFSHPATGPPPDAQGALAL